jgi:Ulp1 family protease
MVHCWLYLQADAMRRLGEQHVLVKSGYFYTKLSNDRVGSLSNRLRELQRESAGVGELGIFGYRAVEIPIHIGIHWALVEVLIGDGSILYVDSLYTGTDWASILENIKRWLQSELDVQRDRIQQSTISKEAKASLTSRLPDVSTYRSVIDSGTQQANGIDCGVCACW